MSNNIIDKCCYKDDELNMIILNDLRAFQLSNWINIPTNVSIHYLRQKREAISLTGLTGLQTHIHVYAASILTTIILKKQTVF